MIDYIAPTDRGNMTKPRRTRIFLAANGICCLCGVQIRAHVDAWFIEHPDALNLGGSDDDKDLRPAHVRCKPKKDATDKALIAKRNGFIDKNCADKPRKQIMPGSRASKWKRRMDGTVVAR